MERDESRKTPIWRPISGRRSLYPSRLLVTYALVRCGAFDVIDDENINRTAVSFEFESELVLHRRIQRWAFVPVAPCEVGIEEARQSGLVHDTAARDGRQSSDEVGIDSRGVQFDVTGERSDAAERRSVRTGWLAGAGDDRVHCRLTIRR